jgi:hypothetical protein
MDLDAIDEHKAMCDRLSNMGWSQDRIGLVLGTVLEESRIKAAMDEVKKEWGNIRPCGNGAGRIKHLITEVYSPPRVNSMIERMGLVPGLSLDLTIVDPEDGRLWDFNQKDKREKAKALVKSGSGLLLIVSPMCAAFSRLQNLNFCRMSKEQVKEVIEYGARHLEFCMDLCRMQKDQGLYFLFEHPDRASSWRNEKVRRLLKEDGVHRIVGHMCQFGMKQEDERGIGWIRKPTGFMTNSARIAKRLEVQCKDMHRHISLIGGRAKKADVYPDRLCKEIVLGLLDQMKEDGRVQEGSIGSMLVDKNNGAEFWDDLSGSRLDESMVRKARKEEIEEYRKHGVYVKVPLEECWNSTGKGAHRGEMGGYQQRRQG